MIPLKKIVFTDDCSYVMEDESCGLNEAQSIIEDELSWMDEFPILAKGKIKRWDGIKEVVPFEKRSIIDLIASCGAYNVYLGYPDDDAGGPLHLAWTHHDGYGDFELSHPDGRPVNANELWKDMRIA